MHKKPYGTWSSTLTAEKVAGAVVAFQDLVLTDDAVYWSEMRPQEKGRNVIVKQIFGSSAQDILPQEFSARSRVHDYGGASFAVIDNVIYFTQDSDQRLYRFVPGKTPIPLTPEGIRFAELKPSPYGLIGVGESHENAGEPENFLACIDPHTGTVKRIATGHDFYASAAISTDGKKIAWICWDHPNMPWDDTQLWCGDLTAQGIENIHQIDAQSTHQSFLQPQFSPAGDLWVLCDKNNWWNLYRIQGDQLIPMFEVNKDIGGPLWVFGQQQWTFYQDHPLVIFSQNGRQHIFKINNGSAQALDLPYSSYSQLRVNARGIAFLAGAPDKPSAVCWYFQEKLTVLRENRVLDLASEEFSMPQHITFQSGTDRKAYGYYYPPKNTAYQDWGENTQDLGGNPQDLSEKPLLIVKSHGGPTGNCGCDFNAEIQYWTQRGYAYVDVNYAGSSGYGRAFRKSLNENWGIFDVEDCIAAADYLIAQGLADPKRLIITGGSAGGFTTLSALTFTDRFHAGACLYGVSDLAALAQETIKFESRYLDALIGPYPEMKSRYDARSPLFHIQHLSAPVIFFQGEQDKVVPVVQSQRCYEALKAKGIKTALWVFEGEGHGFRQAKTRQQVLMAQEAFYAEVFGLSA